MKKWIIRLLIIGFVLFNISAAFHGYKFTHFSSDKAPKSKLEEMSMIDKAGILFFGISNPRPENTAVPQVVHETLTFESVGEQIEAWKVSVDSARGTVILFHGYSGHKSSMLNRAALVREMGYHTILIDFPGSGGSTGQTTTIGYREAEVVASTVDFARQQYEGPIYLLGTSMGAAAILRAVGTELTEVKGIIIECPFASLLQTAKNRFERLGLPTFPAAHSLVFWGGIENGFWAFSHNPEDYAAGVKIPTLLIYGQQDGRVKEFETQAIFNNLAGEKELVVFPEAGHGNYLQRDPSTWTEKVAAFLETN